MDDSVDDRGDHCRAAARLGMTDAAGSRPYERRPRGWRSVAFDVALGLLAIGAGVSEASNADGTPVAVIVLTVVAGGALILRRWWPLAVLATTLGVAVAIWIIDVGAVDTLEASGASVLVALYTTAALRDLRRSLAGLVPTVVVVTVLSLATADAENRDTSPLAGAIIAATLAVGIWGLGAYAQTRRRYRRELERRAVLLEREREQLARIAAHEERASIARELHDIVAHSVTVMLVGVRGARDVLLTSPHVADETLARVETSGEQSLAELRRILLLLRESERRAESRPQPSLAELDELVANYRDAGLPVQMQLTGEPSPLPSGVELSIYRIVEEALTNVLKHSHPTRVTVTLSFRGSRLEVEVVDDGTTAARRASTERSGDEHAARGGGHGLVGMRERVAVLGGELETGRRVGGGFRVAARLPIGGDA
jgi:signal transduction histidine kinase